MENNIIIIFTKKNCSHCEDAISFLKENEISYIEGNWNNMSPKLKRFIGDESRKMESPSYPIMYICDGEKRILKFGFNEEEMKKYL